MLKKTKNVIDYKNIFDLIEEGFRKEAFRNKSTKERNDIKSRLKELKKDEDRPSKNNDFFDLLVRIVFYSGMTAQTVTNKRAIIKKHFPTWNKVSDYDDKDIKKIMSDTKMIRHESKIKACVDNAKEFKKIVKKYGSFSKYIDAFNAKDSFENLMFLKEDLEARFSYLGGITVYHFLKDIGMPVLKPDRVIMRIFERLGLIDHHKQYLRAIFHGREFAGITNLPIRYIDRVFVAYGQRERKELGLKKGICLGEPRDPRCDICYARSICKYYKKHGPSSCQAP